MAPSSQLRSKRSRSMRRSSTQFGQLEVDMEPAISKPQSQQRVSLNHSTRSASLQKANDLPQLNRTRSDEYENELADGDLMQFDLEQKTVAGVSTSRRSSPAQVQVPENTWDFDPVSSDDEEAMPPMSSPKVENLPDTVPIPTTQEVDQGVATVREERSNVDLSETASTARRSPSVHESEARGFSWGLNRLSSSRATSKHPPMDDEQSSAAEDSPPSLQAITVEVTEANKHANTRLNVEHKNEVLPSEKFRGNTQPDLQTDSVPEAHNTMSLHHAQLAPETTRGRPASSKNSHLVPTVTEEAHCPPDNIIRANASKTHHHEHYHSPETQQIQEDAAYFSARSGKKRKQRAKEPLAFDSETQAVKEGPPPKKRSPPKPKPKPAVEAAKKSPPTTATKRPATKFTARPAKKPKADSPSLQAPTRGTSRKTGSRAAAQLARAAVQRQLSSSPSSKADSSKGSRSRARAPKPVVESASKYVANPTDGINHRPKLSPKVQKLLSGPKSNVGSEKQTTSTVSKAEKVPNEPIQDQSEDPSLKALAGASGRIRSAARTKLQDKMIKDSQDDTQDILPAHFAEEKVAGGHVSISSDQSSDLSEGDTLKPRQPKPAPRVINKQAQGGHISDNLLMLHPKTSSADASPQNLADEDMEEEEIPDSMAVSIVQPPAAPRPKQQPPKAQAQHVVHARSDGTHSVSKPAKEKVRQALTSRDSNPRKSEIVFPTKTANGHLGARHPQAEEKLAKQPDLTSQRHPQRSLRPDDAFVDSHEPEDRGRVRVKSSGWTRTLTVSQAGSPSRLSNDGNDTSLASKSAPNMSSATSGKMSESLGHLASDHSRQVVRRRLSYKPTPAPNDKHHEAQRRDSDFEATEITLVDLESSGGKAATNSPQHDTSQAEMSKIKNKIYDQMSAAQQAPEPPIPKPVELQEQPSPMIASREDIARQLHGIIDLVTQSLERSEKDVKKTINVYQEGASGCVRRIERRLGKEHPLLLKQWENDGNLFTRSVKEAKVSIQDAPQIRGRSASELEREVAQRRVLYDQASSSLRAFHNQVMRG